MKDTVHRVGDAIVSNIAREAPLGSVLVAFLLGVQSPAADSRRYRLNRGRLSREVPGCGKWLAVRDVKQMVQHIHDTELEQRRRRSSRVCGGPVRYHEWASSVLGAGN